MFNQILGWLKKPLIDPQKHQVEIHYIDVKPETPYFIALCSCDWVGTPYDLEAPARTDAGAHSTNVVLELKVYVDESPSSLL